MVGPVQSGCREALGMDDGRWTEETEPQSESETGRQTKQRAECKGKASWRLIAH